MAQVDWDQDDPYADAGGGAPPTQPPPGFVPGNVADAPGEVPTWPTDPWTPNAPPKTKPTGSHPWDAAYDPPKPSDPGDGRVWIWMGDQWGLTVPEGAPFGPKTTPAPSGGGGAGVEAPGAPSLNYPGYESSGPFVPRNDTFNFDPFVANPFTDSSWADAEKEPGYDASRTQLRKQVEQGAANRGVLRSGMTIGDLYTNLDALGQQNFKQFDDRRYRNWSGNEADRFQAWSGNLGASRNKFLDEYGIDRDVYDRHATDVDRGNNYRFNAADAGFKDALDRWKTYVGSLTSLARPVE